jgi:desumoylating isopeptidase 1
MAAPALQQQQGERVTVTLHMYDLSQGMAAQLSQSMLGEHFEGIWHTGICAWGEEFFYQSGVSRAAAGRTMFGSPTRVVTLGETSVPKSLFLDFLHGISERYTPEEYHLLDNNCNAFTQECAQFMCGCDIPSDVTSMGDRFRGTPLGNMLGPMIDGMMQQQRQALMANPNMMGEMMGQVPGTEDIRPLSGTEAAAAAARVAAAKAQQGPQGGAAAPAPAARIKLLAFSQPVLFTMGNVPQIVGKLRETLDENASGWQEQWGASLDSLTPFISAITATGSAPAGSAPESNWVDMLIHFIGVLPPAKQFIAFDLLRLLLADRPANTLGAERVVKLVSDFVQLDDGEEKEKLDLPYALQLMVTRTVANCFSASSGANAMMAAAEGTREKTVEFALRALLGKDVRMRISGATLAYNIAAQLPKSDEETATALVSALTHMLQPSEHTSDGAAQAAVALDDETTFTALMALGHVVKDNPQAAELAQILGFSLAKYASSSSDKVRQIAEEVGELLR